MGTKAINWNCSHIGARIVKDTQENSLAEHQPPAGGHRVPVLRGRRGHGKGFWDSARLRSKRMKTANDPDNVAAE